MNIHQKILCFTILSSLTASCANLGAFQLEILWEFPLPGVLESASPAVADDGSVYIASSANGGVDNIFAIRSDGKKKWSHATGDANKSSAAIDASGNVYIGSYDDKLYKFTAGGEQVWTFDTGGNPRYNGATFADDGTVYIGSQSDKLFAINPDDGSKKWEFSALGDFNATPAVAEDGTIYIGNTDDFFYAINPDGTEKWVSGYGSWTAAATAMGEDGTIYFSGERKSSLKGVLIAYNSDGSEKWRAERNDKTARGGPVIAADGTIYLAGEDSQLIAYNPDGSEKWSYDLGAKSKATAAIDNNGDIYIGDDAGFLHVIDARGTAKREKVALGAGIWSSVAISNDGIIYVGAHQADDSSILYALRTNASGPSSEGWPMRSRNAKRSGRTERSAPVQLAFSVDETPLVNTQVSFTNESTGADNSASFQWDFGDGSTPVTARDATHTYSDLGSYTLTLRLTVSTAARFSREILVSQSNVIENRNTLAQALDAARTDGEVIFCAHRGYKNTAPENSLQSITAAINAGIGMVELDVRSTKEGILVLMHDGTVDRTTNGSGYVRDFTLAALKAFRLLNADGSVSNQQVPTLAEALERARGKIYIDLDIDKKSSFSKVFAVVKQYGMSNQVMFYSSQMSVIRGMFAQLQAFTDEAEQFLPLPIIRAKNNDLDQYASFSSLKIVQFNEHDEVLRQRIINRGWHIFRNAYVNSDISPTGDSYAQLDAAEALGASVVQTDHAVTLKNRP